MLRFITLAFAALALAGCAADAKAKIDTAITTISMTLHDNCTSLQSLAAVAAVVPVKTPRLALALRAANGTIDAYCAGPVSTNQASAIGAVVRTAIGLVTALPAGTYHISSLTPEMQRKLPNRRSTHHGR